MRRLQQALTIAFSLSGIAAAIAAEDIRIGQTLPYSGPVSGFGVIGTSHHPRVGTIARRSALHRRNEEVAA